QRQRLLRRLNNEKHNWKFSPGDLKERERWDDYQKYYEEAINKTSKPHAPWFVIPSDNKETARVLVAKAILEQMHKLKDIDEPELDEDVKKNIAFYKEILSKPETNS
ncbi:MAG: polyphosphate kinase 2 family protein, partial [Algoriphagus sp.]